MRLGAACRCRVRRGWGRHEGEQFRAYIRRVAANAKLTFHLDHSAGADHSRLSARNVPGRRLALPIQAFHHTPINLVTLSW